MWQQSDSNTHDYFEQHYQTLVQMDETITDYLPQTDHQLARRQAGTVLLDKIDDSQGLFAEVVRPQAVVIDQAKKLGLNVDKIKISEDQRAAEVVTRAEQTFHLTREDESRWRVNLVQSLPSLRTRLKWIDNNQSALEKTVDKRIDEEQKRREAIIADLMGTESTGDEGP